MILKIMKVVIKALPDWMDAERPLDAQKSGDLLRCSVAPILTVHRVRFRFSLGRALHLTTFDDAIVYSRRSSNPARFHTVASG